MSVLSSKLSMFGQDHTDRSSKKPESSRFSNQSSPWRGKLSKITLAVMLFTLISSAQAMKRKRKRKEDETPHSNESVLAPVINRNKPKPPLPKKCGKCEGKGKRFKSKCKECGGTGIPLVPVSWADPKSRFEGDKVPDFTDVPLPDLPTRDNEMKEPCTVLMNPEEATRVSEALAAKVNGTPPLQKAATPKEVIADGQYQGHTIMSPQASSRLWKDVILRSSVLTYWNAYGMLSKGERAGLKVRPVHGGFPRPEGDVPTQSPEVHRHTGDASQNVPSARTNTKNFDVGLWEFRA